MTAARVEDGEAYEEEDELELATEVRGRTRNGAVDEVVVVVDAEVDVISDPVCVWVVLEGRDSSRGGGPLYIDILCCSGLPPVFAFVDAGPASLSASR